MAQAIKFPECDEVAYSVSGKPGVFPLPIKAFPQSSTSCWRLTPEEIAEIVRTGVVWIATSLLENREGEPVQPILRVEAFKNNGLRGID